MPFKVHSALLVRTLFLCAVSFTSSDAWSTALFNLTGSQGGHGDVVGPYLLARAYAHSSGDRTILVVDNRALETLRAVRGQPALTVGQVIDGLELIDPARLATLNGITATFDLFTQARSRAPVTLSLPAQLSALTRITTQDLHFASREQAVPKLGTRYLSEVQTPTDHWYFAPAGVSLRMGGVVPDKEVDPYRTLTPTQSRQLAAAHFGSDSAVKAILVGQNFVRLGFVYGLGNLGRMLGWTNVDPSREVFYGQFLAYLRGAVERLNQGPIIVFTPNSVKKVRAELDRPAANQTGLIDSEPIRVMDAAELTPDFVPERKVYVVSLGALTRPQMVGLMASSDEPLLLEGDGTLSTAARLGRPFAMFRSPWSFFAVDDVKRALKEVGAKWTDRFYPLPERPPRFSHIDDLAADRITFRNLANQVRTFDQTLLEVVSLVSDPKRSPEDILRVTTDRFLKVSVLHSLFAKGRLDGPAFQERLSRVPDGDSILLTIKAHIQARVTRCAREMQSGGGAEPLAQNKNSL